MKKETMRISKRLRQALALVLAVALVFSLNISSFSLTALAAGSCGCENCTDDCACEEECTCTSSETGETCSCCAAAKVSIGETTTYYATLEKAIAAVNAMSATDSTIKVTLLKDATVTDSIEVSKSLILDLGGKSLTHGSNGESNQPTMTVAEGVTLIVKDSTLTSTNTTGTGSMSNYGKINAQGTLDISALYYATSGTTGLISGTGGTVIIGANGTFIAPDAWETLEISSGVTWSPTVASYSNSGKAYVISGKEEGSVVRAGSKNWVYTSSNTWVGSLEVITYSGENNDTASEATNYTSLSAAVAAANGGTATIKLLSDVSVQAAENTTVVINGENITIDLNGYNISKELQADEAPTSNSGMSRTTNLFRVTKGTLKITGEGTITDGYSWYVIQVLGSTNSEDTNYSTLYIDKDVTVHTLGWSVQVQASSNLAYGVTVDVYGTLEAEYECGGLTVNGTVGSGQTFNEDTDTTNYPVINIYGTLKALYEKTDDPGIGLYGAGYANYNIYEGATITGSTGVEVRAGNLNVYGGTIIGDMFQTAFSSTGNNNGSTTNGAGIAVAQHTTCQPISVNITGGDITGYYALYEGNPQASSDENLKKIKINVEGGTFTSTDTTNGAAVYIANMQSGQTSWTYSSTTVTNNQITGMISVSGGYFNTVLDNGYCATDYTPDAVATYYSSSEAKEAGEADLYSVHKHGSDGVVTTDAKDATCTETGISTTYYYCKYCDTYYSNKEMASVLVDTSSCIAPALGHSFTDEPTFTWSDDGQTCTATFTCTREGCDQTVERECTITSEVKTESTCTVMGTTTYTATVQYEAENEDNAATDASYATYTDTKDVQDIALAAHTAVTDAAVAATCTSTGLTVGYHCSVCNTVLTAQTTTAALGHSYGEGVVTKEAEVGVNGVMTYTCTRCSETYTKPIAALSEEAEEETQTTVFASTSDEEIASVSITIDAVDDLLSDAEQAIIDAGGSVELVLEVATKDEEAVAEAEVTAIETAIASTETEVSADDVVAISYLDINLTKYITTATGTLSSNEAVTDVGSMVTITVSVPQSLLDAAAELENSKYTVIRVHDGVATVLETTYDAETETVTFQTDQFSTYAIVCESVKAAEIKTVDGVKYKITSDGTVTVYGLTKKTKASATKIVIPATVTIDGVSYKVTAIGEKAFKGAKLLKKVTIGKNVTTIGDRAFAKCSSLKKVVVKGKLSSVGKKVFNKVKNTVTVTAKNKTLKKTYAKYFVKTGAKKVVVKKK